MTDDGNTRTSKLMSGPKVERPVERPPPERLGRGSFSYLLAGLITVVPLIVTVLLVQFVFEVLSGVGAPTVRWIATRLGEYWPSLAGWLGYGWIESGLAALIVLVGLYVLGFASNRVIGRRIVVGVESILRRLPMLELIYGSVRRLLEVLQTGPSDAKRVVFLRFPSPQMKTVGLVTRTFIDAGTGRKLAAVYVPTTPNPTSGYLEIVPIEDLTPTEWTIDDAMTFVISGGAIAPDTIHYDGPPVLVAAEEPRANREPLQ